MLLKLCSIAGNHSAEVDIPEREGKVKIVVFLEEILNYELFNFELCLSQC